MFMGVKEDGETAIFLQSSAASSTGEGNCEPDDTCTFLYMKKGDKQRIEAVNENDEVVTYELVLLDIDVKRTDGPEKAAELQPQQAVEALGAQRRGRKGARPTPSRAASRPSASSPRSCTCSGRPRLAPPQCERPHGGRSITAPKG